MSGENISFTDFTDAFDDSIDYQIDGNDDITVDEDTALEGNEADEVSADEGSITDNASEDAGVSPERDAQPADNRQETQQSDTFILKVNKEEKTCSREEVISLAQKGADYDRVKDQLNQSRQTVTDLQSKLAGQQETMDALSDIAEDMKIAIPDLIENLRVGALRKQGLSETEAKERVLRIKAERENAALRAQSAEKGQAEEGTQRRAQRELAEFRSTFPDVQLTDELIGKLMNDVQGGMSLTNAYQKYENAQKDAQIAELQAQLAAEKQNRENLASSPGSLKDSGGRRTKSDYDDFMEAFK